MEQLPLLKELKDRKLLKIVKSSRVNEKANPLFKISSYIFSVIAEQEREQIKERNEMGKVAARQKGVVFGKKQGSNELRVDFFGKDGSKKISKYLSTGEYTIRKISKCFISITSN